MKNRSVLLFSMMVAAMACGKKDKETPPAPAPAPDPATEAPASNAPAPPAATPAAPPDAATVVALMRRSDIALDVDPPATLQQHVADAIPEGAALPKVDCKQEEARQSCSVWATDAFFYQLELQQTPDGWQLVPDAVEVLPND